MKNKFLKSTLILLIGGCITKIIGLVIKVITTRTIGIDGVALLALINPTYSLLLSLANFNILVSTSKRISAKANTKKVLINSCYIMFVLNVLLILFMFLVCRFLSVNLLKSKEAYYPLLACTLSLPFVSLGYIVKGYFYGKQNVTPHMISNVLEQMLRLSIIAFILPYVIPYGRVVTITVLMLLNIVSESFSIIMLLLFIPKNKIFHKEDIGFDKVETKEILAISVPSVSGRILGNIGFFFEPIILNSVLLYAGCTTQYISIEYGVYNAYVIGTLLFPSFIIAAISNALLPEISKFYANRDMKMVRSRIRQSILLSLGFGIVCTIAIYLSAEFLLKILYNTTAGVEYIKVLAPFFILFYLEAPLCSILTGINKVKTCTIISTTGIVLKLGVMVVLGLLGFKIYCLIIAEIVDIFYVTSLDYIALKRELKRSL